MFNIDLKTHLVEDHQGIIAAMFPFKWASDFTENCPYKISVLRWRLSWIHKQHGNEDIVMVQSNIVTNKLLFINFSLGHVSWWRTFVFSFHPKFILKKKSNCRKPCNYHSKNVSIRKVLLISAKQNMFLILVGRLS